MSCFLPVGWREVHGPLHRHSRWGGSPGGSRTTLRCIETQCPGGKAQEMSPMDTGKSINAWLRTAIFPGRGQDGAVLAAFQIIYPFF